MADNTLLRGTYSMAIQGFVRGPQALAGIQSPDPRPDVVLDPVIHGTVLVPETDFAVSEAPVIAGYLPSEQFPPLPGKQVVPPHPPDFRVHGGYRPFAALGIVRFDGNGGIEGSGQVMIGGNPSFRSGSDFLPMMNQVAIQPGYSGYEVDPAGQTARARIAYDFDPQIDAAGNLDTDVAGRYNELHVLVFYLTILAGAEELHCLAIGSNGLQAIESGVLKRV